MQSIVKRILGRIQGKGRGAVFVPKDFLDLGGRAAVDQALSRLARRGVIRRVGRGLYDYPRVSPLIGTLSPRPDAVAQAVARRSNSRLQVSGAQAANALGLSTQVPARLTYLTDGTTRRVQVGKQTIMFRHAAPQHMLGAGTLAGTVLQALRYLGRDGVDQRAIRTITSRLTAADKHALKRVIPGVSDWLRPVVDQIAHAA